MRILPLLVAIACYHCVGSVPAAILSRIRRVSGYEDPELDKDETTTDYMDYSYEEYEVYDESMFTCISGNEKIPLELMCDGFYDCTDRSDEVIANCQDNGISRTAVTTTAVPVSSETTATMLIEPDIMYVGDYEDYVDACTENEFQCLSDISICLPHSQVCDDVNDCPGKEDESRCPGKDIGSWSPSKPERLFGWKLPDVLKKARGVDYEDYSSIHGNKNPSDVDAIPTKETVSITEGAVRPKIVFKEPPQSNGENDLIFVNPKREETGQNLGLEVNYRYIDVDEEGNMLNSPLNADSEVQNNTTNHVTDNIPPLSSDHEIEINHETGEVTVIEDGVRRLLPLQAIDRKRFVEPQHEDEARLPTRTHETSEKSNSESKITKGREDIRGIVGQLLHHIGSIMEEESNEDDFGNLNVHIGLDDDAYPENSLYNRLLCKRRTHVTLNFDIRI